MINPLEFYQHGILENGGLVGAKIKYYNDVAQKYFTPTPQLETSQQLLAFKHLISGKIYTYQYSPAYTNRLDWYDTRPIIISIRHRKAKTTKNEIEFGINLNFLPPSVRRFVLVRLYEVYKLIIDRNIKLYESGDTVNQKPLFTGNYDFMKVLDFLWDSVGNTAYRFALRNYIFDRMQNIKAIDYDDWGKILFVESKEISGATIGDIYRKYYGYKLNKNNQKKKANK